MSWRGGRGEQVLEEALRAKAPTEEVVEEEVLVESEGEQPAVEGDEEREEISRLEDEMVLICA